MNILKQVLKTPINPDQKIVKVGVFLKKLAGVRKKRANK